MESRVSLEHKSFGVMPILVPNMLLLLPHHSSYIRVSCRRYLFFASRIQKDQKYLTLAEFSMQYFGHLRMKEVTIFLKMMI